MVRASNSGISAFINPVGDVVSSLPYGAEGVLTHVIELRSGVTPYARWGRLVVPLCFGAIFVSVGVALIRHPKVNDWGEEENSG